MDAFGHVNNVTYFRYFESARIKYFEELFGDSITSKNFAPILASTQCNYHRPVIYPDTLLVEAAVSRLGNSSLTMEYRLTSERQGEVVASGQAVVVNVDPEAGKSRPLGEELKENITKLQDQSAS